MHISYNEFHISRKVRDLCSFEKGLFASSGNVVFANMKNVRDFQLLFNNYIQETTKDENKKVSAGQLNAMGLIDEILHYVCMLYRRDKVNSFMTDLLALLNKEFGTEQVDGLLLDFIKEFPPVEVYDERTTAEDYLNRTAMDAGTKKERTNREQTLEELILLHLANENPAFKPFNLLFSDKTLSKNKLYSKTWTSIQKFAQKLPGFGPYSNTLISLLREPMMFSPESLKGQLDYIQTHWADFLGEWLKRILAGMDAISEEEKAMWQGFGGGLPDMEPYSYENLMNEYERFSADSDWMPNVILMAKTVLVWLDQLTKQYGYPITRLDQIPDPELDRLRDEGFTGLWLIGLWERSKASKRIKQICGNPEAAASAYSLYDYNIAQNIGGWDALANLRQRCWQRGIRLASDMVPNHTGMDGNWVMNRPDLFIQRRDCPFPHYSFNGENLSQDPRTSIFLEDHYYSKNDCAVVFKRVDNQTGDVRYIYHGNDGTGLPWNDTAQIDFLNPEAREAVMQEILHVAQNFPIIRFDAAMVLAKKSIRRLWYPEPGHGGDIATRSETGLSTKQFNDAIPNEFWREVVDRVAKECPDTLLLAEAFWMMEGYFVRTLGMHRVYNSAFMNMLKKEQNQKYRETVKNTITFDPQVLKRYVNFMNNPDEETAIAQFGDGDKYFGCCTLMITMPGLPMFGHGQIEGFTEKYGMEYTKAYKDEKPNQYLIDRHWHDIFPLMKKRWLFSGVDNFLFYDLWEDGHVNENVFAYSNGAGNERAVVFYNNKYEQAHGWIKLSDPYAFKNGTGIEMKTRTIGEGLNLTADSNHYCIFQEHRSGLWFIRRSSDICEKGMFVMLNGFEYQVFLNIYEVQDTSDNRYRILCDFLNGSGCVDIETAWQEIIYKDLYTAMAEYVKKVLPDVLDIKEEKKIPLILKASEKEALAFETECVYAQKKIDEAVAKGDKKSKSKVKAKTEAVKKSTFIKDVTDRLTRVTKINNKKPGKKPADLTKALLKCEGAKEFIYTFKLSDENLKNLFVLWALCGKISETTLSVATGFARKFDEFVKEMEASKEIKECWKNGYDAKKELTRLFILSSTGVTEKTTKKKEEAFVKTIIKGNYSGLLSGANCFDNIWWFNKETSDYSLALFTSLKLLGAKKSQEEEILTMYKELSKAKTKAAYKCDLFTKQFESAKKKVDDKVKKTATAGGKKSAGKQKASSAAKTTAGTKSSGKKASGTKKTDSGKKASGSGTKTAPKKSSSKKK